MYEKGKQFYYENLTDSHVELTFEKEARCDSGGVSFVLIDEYMQVVPANSTEMINFPSDGNFKILVDGVESTTVNYNYNLFTSLVLYTEAAICDEDNSCLAQSHCIDAKSSYLETALSKLLLYYSINTTKYNDELLRILPQIRCTARPAYEKNENLETIQGVGDVSEITKIEIAYLYLGLYNIDIAGISPPSNMDTVEGLKEIYNYDALNYCISRLGVKDCDPYVPPGEKHSATFSVAPTTIKEGEGTDITVTYQFQAKGDEFISVVSQTPGIGASISDLIDGNIHTVTIPNQSVGTNYFITYSYKREGNVLQATVSAKTTAYAAQWFGGESTVANYLSGIPLNTIKTDMSKPPVYQGSSNSTSSNTDTKDKYIWWITNREIRFMIGSFEIQTGPWNDNCDPNAYAIIHKTVDVTRPDGSVKTMHFYRTCALQDLTGMTLNYTLVQK